MSHGRLMMKGRLAELEKKRTPLVHKANSLLDSINIESTVVDRDNPFVANASALKTYTVELEKVIAEADSVDRQIERLRDELGGDA